jgi:hypothetical protein
MPSDRMTIINSICSEVTIRSLQDAASYVAQIAGAWGLDTQDKSTSALLSRLAEAEFRAARNPESGISDSKMAAAFNTFATTVDPRRRLQVDERGVRAFRQISAAQYPQVFRGEVLRPVAASILFYLLAYNGGVPNAAVEFVEQSRPGPLTLNPKSSRLRLAEGGDNTPNYVQTVSSFGQTDRVYALNNIATQLGF